MSYKRSKDTAAKTSLYPYQRQGIDGLKKLKRGLLADEPGLGKAQPLSSKLLTPEGWILMGEVKVGDRLIGKNGLPCRVTGVFPQGIKPVYSIKFNDKTSVKCCGDHLWEVKNHNDRVRKSPPRIMTTEELIANLNTSSGKTKRWHVPIVSPIHFEKQAGPLDPYLVGYLIANGSLTRATPHVTIPDEETAIRIQKLIPNGCRFYRMSDIDYSISKEKGREGRNPLKLALTYLNLQGKGFAEKSIPANYLYGSLKDRIALLQGLMDGDGSAFSEGIVLEYSTGSEKLAEQFSELIWSFGGLVRVTKRTPHYTYRGERKQGSVSFKINISLPKEIQPFRLTRKVNAYKPRSKYQPTRVIREIVPNGKEPCQCISVDAEDKLYVTDNYTVTHNTVQALTTVKELDGFPALVICPASLKINWAREAHKHFGMKAKILTGTKSERWDGKMPQLVVANYDILKDRIIELSALRFKSVVADEGHYLQNRSSKRTRCVRGLMKDAEFAFVLTGTPITNRPADLWPILNMLRPGLFGSFMEFCQKFARPKKRPWGWTFDGAKNLPELHELLTEHLMVRRRKCDVLKDLPAKRRIVVPLDVTNRKQYEGAKKDFIGWLAKHAPEKLSSAERAKGLALANHLKQLIGKLKIPAVVEWTNNFLEESGDKIILFAYHRDVIETLCEAFGDAAVKVYGGLTDKRRQAAFDAFNASDSVRVMVGQIESAGQGWSCRSTSTCAFAELDWRASLIDQATDRTHGVQRGVEGKHSTNFFLLAHESIEEALARAIERKQKIARAVVDGGEGEIMDLFTEFCRIVAGKEPYDIE